MILRLIGWAVAIIILLVLVRVIYNMVFST